MKKNVLLILEILIGNLFLAASVRLFLTDSGLITGGGTGIALMLNHLCGFRVSTTVLIINVVMLITGFLFLGKTYALTTLVSTFAYPVFLELLDLILGNWIPTQDILLCTVFSGLGFGIALGIVFRAGASTGGMDTIPLMMHKYLRISAAVAMNAVDVVILLLQAWNNSMDMILYGIIHVLIYTIVMDKVMLLGSRRLELKIVSQRSEDIRKKILEGLDRGVTILQGRGGYTGDPTELIISVINNRELARMEKLIHSVDPKSFIIITQVSEVRGRGFSLDKEYRPFVDPGTSGSSDCRKENGLYFWKHFD